MKDFQPVILNSDAFIEEITSNKEEFFLVIPSDISWKHFSLPISVFDFQTKNKIPKTFIFVQGNKK